MWAKRCLWYRFVVACTMSSTDSDITPPSSPILNVESPSERSKSPPPLSVASNLTRQVQVKPTDDSSDSSASKTEYEQLATSRKRSSTARHEQYSLNCSLPVPSKGAPSSTKKLKQVKREDGSTTSEEEVNIHVDSRQPDVVRTKPLRSFLIDDILSHKPKRSHSSTVCSKTNGHAEQGVHVAHNDHRLQCSPTNYAKIVRPWDVPAARLAAPSAFPTFSPPNPFNGSYYHSPLFLRQHAHSPQTTVRPRSADEDTRSEASSDVAESPGGASNCNTINSPLDALFELANKAFDRPEEKCGGEFEMMIRRARRLVHRNESRVRAEHSTPLSVFLAFPFDEI